MATKFILTDIEGTTTSITFVKDVLFPYAYAHLPAWVRAHAHEEKVMRALAGTKATVQEEEGRNLDDDEAVGQLLEWIKADRKQTDLKALQGWIWEDGYNAGAFVSHIYPDVLPALQKWQEAGFQLGVYSSGSVEAQLQLFGHTTEGNLLPYFSRFFDTSIGHKRERSSYENIALALGLEPSEILFLSDIPEELDAAVDAGMQVQHLVREGTTSVQRYPGVASFLQIRP
jgi:enolase-phosphatase E1